MKKLSLLAAAAMVAGGSVFAMDGGGVSISGSANFGVKYNEENDTLTSNALAFHHEFDITFAASGTTDGGIGFGAKVTIDNQESVGSSSTTTGAVNAVVVHINNAEAREAAQAKYGIVIPGADTIANDSRIVIVDGADTLSGYEIFTPTAEDTTTAPGASIATTGIITGVDDNATFANAEAAAAGVAKALTKTGTTNVNSVGSVANHAEVYISMDMHKLTIGSDLDAADKLAGGLKDPGFDGIGIDDVAEGPYGESAKDVRYDGDFGVAKVAISYGDNKGDADWAAGFSFNVEPVTFGAGFDNHGVMSIGMGFTQGQIAMNALFSTDSDHDEADNEALHKGEALTAAQAENNDSLRTGAKVGNKSDLKNQAMGVDISYQMSEATSVVLVAAQSKKESAHWSIGDAAANDKWMKTSTTVDAFGVGFSHDLGGGATLSAGAGSVDSNAVADLGISMKF